MGWFSVGPEFEASQRQQRMLEQSKPHEYVAYFIGINSKAIVFELRIIKWLLVAIMFMLIIFAR